MYENKLKYTIFEFPVCIVCGLGLENTVPATMWGQLRGGHVGYRLI